jgi:hypothetical protein
MLFQIASTSNKGAGKTRAHAQPAAKHARKKEESTAKAECVR